ncbi:LacI family transcriptional regulator, partial [Streptomyces sp. SID11233]|nr:LacI family transcriptional regulator [Streptomyces sp. SID11233]
MRAESPEGTETARAEERGAGRITLAQVGAQAGVSLSTVSKVLNGRPDVAAPTRRKVEELLEEHGYRRPA